MTKSREFTLENTKRRRVQNSNYEQRRGFASLRAFGKIRYEICAGENTIQQMREPRPGQSYDNRFTAVFVIARVIAQLAAKFARKCIHLGSSRGKPILKTNTV